MPDEGWTYKYLCILDEACVGRLHSTQCLALNHQRKINERLLERQRRLEQHVLSEKMAEKYKLASNG